MKKCISIKEFRETGYLQELNRRFLHPLGLSLEVEVDPETHEERLSGVRDCRNNPLGILYPPEILEQHAKIFYHAAKSVEQERQIKMEARRKKFGWTVQPVENPVLKGGG